MTVPIAAAVVKRPPASPLLPSDLTVFQKDRT